MDNRFNLFRWNLGVNGNTFVLWLLVVGALADIVIGFAATAPHILLNVIIVNCKLKSILEHKTNISTGGIILMNY